LQLGAGGRRPGSRCGKGARAPALDDGECPSEFIASVREVVALGPAEQRESAVAMHEGPARVVTERLESCGCFVEQRRITPGGRSSSRAFTSCATSFARP